MKKVKHHKLTAEQRPLFTPSNFIHKTKIDKANSRQRQKLETKKLLQEI